ncbi:MAG: TrkH family potassium uptake protein [Lachnospiraceae bacterium]|nr:TrkH family potassium uptake protein [Lachnospiraceae bacterium]
MNTSIIRYILGSVLKIEAFLLLIPVLCGLIYHESEGTAYFAVALICLFVGILFTIRKPKENLFYLKEGCITTALSWILLSIFGAIPFVITGEIPSFLDALFETISGFTTTGASILSDVEELSHASLLWRSFTHWIGGMGVLIFLMAIIPMSGGSNINLMRAESPGPSVGKLVPKMKTTATLLYSIYIFLTALEFLILILCNMPIFDSICTAFGTAGTGGFGIKNSSIGGYSVTIQWVVTIFMILFGINFNAYFFLLIRDFKKALKMEEVRVYLGIIFASVVLISANIYQSCNSVFDAVTKSAFQVASVITTTGFSTTDFDLWPSFSKTVLVILMFIGACAGSTGGGIKVSRIIVIIKAFFKEAFSYIHPKSVRHLSIDKQPIKHDVIRSINVFFDTYIAIFVISLLLVSIEGQSMQTNLTAVIATFNNIGPGLEAVGPTQNFAFFTPLSKVVLMFDMLAGRLELFPMVLLFHPTIWKEMFERRYHSKKQ